MRLRLVTQKYYIKRTGGCRGERCGHYKQIVWKTTEKVGCASAQSDEGQTVIVCNYDPSGNYQGEKAY